jgi:hypothetical protein
MKAPSETSRVAWNAGFREREDRNVGAEGFMNQLGSQRALQAPVMHEARVVLGIERHLDQVEAPGAASRERAGRAPALHQRLAPQMHARPDTRAGAPGLHLDHDQRAPVEEQEVELAPAGLHAPAEEMPAARAKLAFRQALAGRGEERIARIERAQREARDEAREQRAPDEPQALLGSALSSFLSALFSAAPSFSGSITLWMAARAKRMRTLSDTCSTAISLVVVTTVP